MFGSSLEERLVFSPTGGGGAFPLNLTSLSRFTHYPNESWVRCLSWGIFWGKEAAEWQGRRVEGSRPMYSFLIAAVTTVALTPDFDGILLPTTSSPARSKYDHLPNLQGGYSSCSTGFSGPRPHGRQDLHSVLGRSPRCALTSVYIVSYLPVWLC